MKSQSWSRNIYCSMRSANANPSYWTYNVYLSEIWLRWAWSCNRFSKG